MSYLAILLSRSLCAPVTSILLMFFFSGLFLAGHAASLNTFLFIKVPVFK